MMSHTKSAVAAAAVKLAKADIAPKGKAKYVSYMAVFNADPLERIGMIKKGVLAVEAKRIISELSIGQGITLKALNISQATINKKAKQHEILSPEASERVLGFAKLVGQVQTIVQESGTPENFDAAQWMSRWLNEPLPAFGGKRPIELMDTMEGQGVVSKAISQIQTGAYA